MSRNARVAATRVDRDAERARRLEAIAARYRDPKTGACETCRAVCECTGGRVLVCRWCKAVAA